MIDHDKMMSGIVSPNKIIMIEACFLYFPFSFEIRSCLQMFRSKVAYVFQKSCNTYWFFSDPVQESLLTEPCILVDENDKAIGQVCTTTRCVVYLLSHNWWVVTVLYLLRINAYTYIRIVRWSIWNKHFLTYFFSVFKASKRDCHEMVNGTSLLHR